MTRDDFLSLLETLIAAGSITLAEARLARRQFDSGDLTLPDTTVDIEALRVVQGRTDDPDRIQDQFDTAMQQNAVHASNPTAWAVAFATIVAMYLTKQWLAAGGSNRANLVAAWQEQQPFVTQFGATVAVRQAVSRPMSPEAISSRSVLYGGAGRSLWYAESENGLDIFGWVIDYVAVDDGGTCGPCLDAAAASPWLPTTGPRPGGICLGRGRCRCKRIARYSPAEASRLRGTATPTYANVKPI